MSTTLGVLQQNQATIAATMPHVQLAGLDLQPHKALALHRLAAPWDGSALLCMSPLLHAVVCPPCVPVLVMCMRVCVLSCAPAVGFGGWIFTYATNQVGLSEHEGHAVNAAYW